MKLDSHAGRRPGSYRTTGGFKVDIEPKQRKVIVVGALVGAVLGAGVGLLLAQTAPENLEKEKKPVRPLDIFQLMRDAAILLRQIDELRYRM
jgi:gas vesicle protein